MQYIVSGPQPPRKFEVAGLGRSFVVVGPQRIFVVAGQPRCFNVVSKREPRPTINVPFTNTKNRTAKIALFVLKNGRFALYGKDI